MMLLDMHLRHVRPAEEIRHRVETRLAAALGRFGERVGRVRVTLADCNGPRGGVDKQCRIVAAVRPVGRIIVEGRGDNLPALVDATADRIGQLVRRVIGRRRRRRDRTSAGAVGHASLPDCRLALEAGSALDCGSER